MAVSISVQEHNVGNVFVRCAKRAFRVIRSNYAVESIFLD